MILQHIASRHIIQGGESVRFENRFVVLVSLSVEARDVDLGAFVVDEESVLASLLVEGD